MSAQPDDDHYHGLAKYLDKNYNSITKAEYAIETCLGVLNFLKDYLDKHAPHATTELSILKDAIDIVESSEIDD